MRPHPVEPFASSNARSRWKSPHPPGTRSGGLPGRSHRARVDDKRLGELYEARGATRKAAESYARLVRLWRRGDGELQAMVIELRTRLQHAGVVTSESTPTPRALDHGHLFAALCAACDLASHVGGDRIIPCTSGQRCGPQINDCAPVTNHCPWWIRTTIPRSKVWCPAIGRRGRPLYCEPLESH
jgi:hypothetical protein